MSRAERPDSHANDVKVARTDGGVTFREVGSADAWIFVASENDLVAVEA